MKATTWETPQQPLQSIQASIDGKVLQLLTQQRVNGNYWHRGNTTTFLLREEPQNCKLSHSSWIINKYRNTVGRQLLLNHWCCLLIETQTVTVWISSGAGGGEKKLKSEHFLENGDLATSAFLIAVQDRLLGLRCKHLQLCTGIQKLPLAANPVSPLKAARLALTSGDGPAEIWINKAAFNGLITWTETRWHSKIWINWFDRRTQLRFYCQTHHLVFV